MEVVVAGEVGSSVGGAAVLVGTGVGVFVQAFGVGVDVGQIPFGQGVLVAVGVFVRVAVGGGVPALLSVPPVHVISGYVWDGRVAGAEMGFHHCRR